MYENQICEPLVTNIADNVPYLPTTVTVLYFGGTLEFLIETYPYK